MILLSVRFNARPRTTLAAAGSVFGADQRPRQAFVNHDLGHISAADGQHPAAAAVVASLRAFRPGRAGATDLGQVQATAGNELA